VWKVVVRFGGRLKLPMVAGEERFQATKSLESVMLYVLGNGAVRSPLDIFVFFSDLARKPETEASERCHTPGERLVGRAWLNFEK